jgi:hypothetical protein
MLWRSAGSSGARCMCEFQWSYIIAVTELISIELSGIGKYGESCRVSHDNLATRRQQGFGDEPGDRPVKSVRSAYGEQVCHAGVSRVVCTTKLQGVAGVTRS